MCLKRLKISCNTVGTKGQTNVVIQRPLMQQRYEPHKISRTSEPMEERGKGEDMPYDFTA